MEFSISGGGAGGSEYDRCITAADRLLAAHDFAGSKRFSDRALELDPASSTAECLSATAEILLVAQQQSPNPSPYAILRVDPTNSDPKTGSRNFRHLALLLRSVTGGPHSAATAAAIDAAFNVISQAFDQLKNMSGNNSSAAASAGDAVASSIRASFWTACPGCCCVHEYARKYVEMFGFQSQLRLYSSMLIIMSILSYEVNVFAAVLIGGNSVEGSAFQNVHGTDLGATFSEAVDCWSYDQPYLTSSYIAEQNNVLDSEFDRFLVQKIASQDTSNGLEDRIGFHTLSAMSRELRGEGAHRNLISSVRVGVEDNYVAQVDDLTCEAVFIERLPDGVFVDPFELRHLVGRRVFLDAAAFGDTNLELPSALSNRSMVEVHTYMRHCQSQKCWEIIVELPLHARYPPLSLDGYATVQFGSPDLFIRCKPRASKQDAPCWALFKLNSRSEDNITWKIPCGNESHAELVALTTFASALVCAFVIISSSCYSSNRKYKTA